MTDTPESKPPFWSSLPGIFTGLGALIVALTGLITALYSNGVIGPKSNSNSNAVPPVNVAATLTSAPSPSPTPDYDRLTGKWRVIETPSQAFNIRDVQSVTWDYDATVSGNVLTLTGSIRSFNDNENDGPKKGEQDIRVTYKPILTGLTGEGEYSFKMQKHGEKVPSKGAIQLANDLRKFEVKIEVGGKTYTLTGTKL